MAIAVEMIQGKHGEYSPGVIPGPPLVAGSRASAHFPTVNEYMRASHPDIFRIQSTAPGFTVSVYCCPTNINAGSSEKKIAWCNNPSGTGEHSWSLSLAGTNRMQPLAQWNYDGIAAEQQAAIGQILKLDLTYERTWVGNTGTFCLYTNGLLCASKTIDYLPNGLGDNLHVGDPSYPGSGGFIGYVSDIMIHDRALTADEINYRYWPNPNFQP